MDKESTADDPVEVGTDQLEQIEELMNPMTKDEKDFWAECYKIAMKNVMYNHKYLCDSSAAGSLAYSCKTIADRALAKYREKKLDVRK